jgi:hypothetical protein
VSKSNVPTCRLAHALKSLDFETLLSFSFPIIQKDCCNMAFGKLNSVFIVKFPNSNEFEPYSHFLTLACLVSKMNHSNYFENKSLFSFTFG